ncbi:MAG: xanthine phosphoribosyltransferase [Lachnospiraceae bacterium]|nr:xanthine phosphoribosyltransferase [Lachnospiraceae bacterium]
MKLLEEKIIKEGRIYPGQVLKVGAFLNHQIDVPFMNKVAEEFYNLFKDEPITKILTIETSGIGIACLTANIFNVPVLYAKKSKGINIGDDVYTVQVTSYTHKNVSNVIIEKQFLGPDDVVLILDDFLANGCALEGLLDLVKMAGARAVGCGIVIEKAFQDGGTRLREKGIRIESLARIKSMDVVEGIVFID